MIGLSPKQQYYGSLVSYSTNYGSSTTKITPSLIIERCNFTDNKFIGPKASLIYSYNGRLQIYNSTSENNGFYSDEIFYNNSENLHLSSPDTYFEYESYEY